VVVILSAEVVCVELPILFICFLLFVSVFFYCQGCGLSPVDVVSGARGGVVVKALRYKPAGRGFDS